MAISQRLINMDAYYRNTKGNKVILNDLDYLNIDDIEHVNNMLMTVYDTDTITTIPSCECGASKGRYLLNKICSSCGSKVTDPQEQLEPVMWLKSLSGIKGFVNPHYWLMLRTILGKKADWLRWLCDTSYNPPGEIPNYVSGVKEMLGERSYNVFVNNIDNVLIYLSNQSKYRDVDSQTTIKILLDMYRNQNDRVLSTYLPIVNKKLFVMENTNKGKFTNLAVSDMIDLIMLWVKASGENLTPRRASNVTASIISKMSALYKTYLDDYVARKEGIFRKHIYGARSHFTFRAVITSIPGPHQYDEIWVPWSIGVTAFRPHLLNKLIKLGYTYKNASALLFKSVKKHDDVIARLLDELITDSKDGIMYCMVQRNYKRVSF